jgi:branched-chain amino acid transport system permease protein
MNLCEEIMTFWVSQIFNGISYGALLFLLAGGLTLIFGAMNIINVAHGSFYLIGGYIGFEVIRLTGNFYIGILAAGIFVGILGLIIEPVFLRRMEGKEPGNDLKQMLVTMGIAVLIQDFCLLIWGGDPYMIQTPSYLKGAAQIGQFFFPKIRLFIIAYSILIFLCVWWFYGKTSIGAKLRATVDNDEMASGLGINVGRIRRGVFALGALLCGFGGVIGCSFMGVALGIEFEILPLAFVIVILGGTGSLTGALVGSLVVGITDNLGKALFPELSYFTLFAPLVIILAFKPTGLFGKG